MIKLKKSKKIRKRYKNYPKFIPRTLSSSKTAFHKITSKEIPLIATLSNINTATDVGGTLIGCPDFVGMGTVYKRYKILGLKVSLMSVLPTSTGQASYPLYVGYNPNTLTSPGAPSAVLDLGSMKEISAFSTIKNTLYCKPKASSNAAIAQNNPTPDEDGFIAYSVDNPPYYGSIQYFQSQAIGQTGICWIVIFTYYAIFTYEG